MCQWTVIQRVRLAAMLIQLAMTPAAVVSAQPAGPAPDARPRCNLQSRFATPDHPMRDILAGIVELADPLSICSGALATLPGRPSSAKALVLTAGHCTGIGTTTINGRRYPGAGEVYRDLRQRRVLSLQTRGKPEPKTCIATETLLYATMTGQDIALYELTESFDEIEARTSVRPFRIASGPGPASGTMIRAPSGRWENELRCSIDTEVASLREHVWSWGPLLRFTSDCTFRGGASGSPVIRIDTSEIIGVVGTVFGGGTPCALHNPCEVDATGQTLVQRAGTSYAALAHLIALCADAKGRLDVARPGCPLARP